ncbi:hypothetical protein CJ204_00880 [Corynebacterium xerosis]|uniref:Uncharacterized protein n=1 Tax=Corynebacterium xerosis TaxID=1725 RepID=A0A2N6T277_9CORY|nr:hypothetical protein [Corynebacterium xerosis]PMC63406.1 hypothetical protein CJ204_00880 [Corynebacterium xerosis]
MTTNDQPHTIPADKVRAARDLHRDAAKMVTITDAEREIHQHVADAMEALLPSPPRPTLADMTPEERRACKRMQAEVANRSVRYVIVNPYDEEGDAALTSADGGIEWFSPERVTPRPDLPRMEWPDEAPVPPNTLAEGSEWDDADALARACEESKRDQIVVSEKSGYVFVWDDVAGWWKGSAVPRFSPFTILHAGKKAHQ